MQEERVTLTQFIIDEQRKAEGATGDFSALLNDIATASKTISHAISRGCLGSHGEDPKIFLEKFAHDAMIKGDIWAGHLAGIASEATEGIMPIPDEYPRGKYLLIFDPLNGSGNLDINFMTGTIFSVLRAPDPSRPATAEDFLQPGKNIVAAGFVLYGASTRLVYSTGQGVNGFTLDRDLGEYMLTHRNMRLPDNAATFAINASNERFWEPPVRRYVQECMAGSQGPRGRDFGMRWASSLIAETFRILVRGGVFLYPVDEKTRDKGGRLGLLYEANPIGFIIEQAGGGAITGRNRLLDLKPSELHQRAPFIFGSKSEIDRIHGYHLDYVEGRDHNSYDLPLFGNRSLFRNE